MFNGTTSIELILWLISMLAVVINAGRCALKLSSYEEETAAIPKQNAKAGATLFKIIAINYLIVALGCVIMYFASPLDLILKIHQVLDTWWLIEIFLFFNIITAYSLNSAAKRILVNI